MNLDKIKGTAKDAEGKVQRKTGEALGDTGQQIKGAAKQAEGKIQKGLGEARDSVDKNKPSDTKRR